MLAILLQFMWWLQPAPSGGGGGAGAAADGAAGGGMGCAMQAGIFALMFAVFYFFLIRPEQKRRKEHEEMLRAIKKGTKVRTTGGILGEVVSLGEDDVVLQVADKVRINVLRAHVATVEEARKAEASKAGDEPEHKKRKKKDETAEARDEA